MLRVTITLLFMFLSQVVFSQHEKPSNDYKNCDFQAIGHRGYSNIYPENTLLSIEEAFKRGVKYCEIDVNVTSDDVYVLFHDQPTMYRTSNGNSYVVSETYQELLQLDLGSWKGSQFAGTKIATLDEALLLAEKYDAYLYLDTKKYRPDLMGNALKNTNVNPKRLMPAIANLEEALAFRKYCPQSNWVYFGQIPENELDENWYKTYTELGCAAFEVYYTLAINNEEKFQNFVKNVHKFGAKVWVFTSNNLNEIEKIKAAGVDGVESDIAITVLKSFCDQQKINFTPFKLTTANYTFDQKNLQSTGIGSQLRPLSYDNPEEIQAINFGTTAEFGIKNINEKIANVIKIPAFNPKNGLFLFTNFTPGIHEDLHYEYSLLMDLYLPKNSQNKFISLLQTNPENENDADLFINPKGIGIENSYQGQLLAETWVRVVIVVTEKAIKKYINGSYVGETPIKGGRWSVYNTFPGGQNQGFLLFADDDNETAELFVNALQLRNYAMDNTEIAMLKTADAVGIPINNSGIYEVMIEGELSPSIVNWDHNEIYITLPKSADLSKVKLSFKMPYGAKSNLISSNYIDLTDKKNREVTITAQDGITKTSWKIIPEIK